METSEAGQGRTITRLTSLGLVAIAYFVAVIVVMHFLRPDSDPMRRPTSDYAVGPFGFLMTSAFLTMAVACVALVVGLYRRVPETVRSRVGLGFMGVWVLGLLVAATFPIDLEGAPQTTSGTIHQINGPIAFISLTIGVILVSLGFRQDEQWRPLYRPALILALVMVAGLVVNRVGVASGAGYPGLAQRVLLATFVTWFVLTAARLRRAA